MVWKTKSVIFCTPQVAVNDLKAGRLEGARIVCVVIDEAHKATGGYAYTTFIEELSAIKEDFRVTALSATPGTDISKIQNVSLDPS